MLDILKTINVTFQYPGLLLIVLIISGYFITLWYLKPLRGIVTRIEYLFVLSIRTIIIALLCTLVFKPQVSWQKTVIENKKHLLLFDNSLSVSTSDSGYPSKVKELCTDLLVDEELNSRLAIYTFGDSLRSCSGSNFPQFNSKLSNLTGSLNSDLIKSDLQQNKIGSIYLVSDGLFNGGENPLNLKLKVPVHAIVACLADNTIDLRLEDVYYPETGSSKEQNKWEISVGYQNPGLPFSAEVELNTDKIVSGKQKISVPSGSGFLRVNINPDLPEQKISEIAINVISGQPEKNYVNNKGLFYQKKAGSQDKILIVSAQPSLDYRFLAELCKKNNLSFDRVNPVLGLKEGSTESYKTIIVLDLPEQLSPEFTAQLRDAGNGLLVFINSNTSLTAVADLLKQNLPKKSVMQRGFLQNNRNPNSEFLYNSAGSSLTLTNLPEISFLNGINLSGAQYWPVLDVVYQNNLINAGWITKSEKTKIAVLNLENFWKLLFEVNNITDSEQISGFLLNLIAYLGSAEGEHRLAVVPDKAVFQSGEAVSFSGKYYDRSFKLQSGQKIRLKLIDRKEEIWLDASGDGYRGAIPLTAPGLYEYIVEVVQNGQVVDAKKGSFKINANSIELSRLNPDSALMGALAQKNGGEQIDFKQLKDRLKQLPAISLIKKQNNSVYPTISLWYLLTLVLLFTMEWIWRKLRNL